ncbi:hypothetical protein BDY17DRAFT_325144 [Neohortaea acidophila]|uniref:Uncharacterized protein n=1 Tax=Neohortaea acidophila TaxID=245834 RepID=A0A6A6PPL6_9PEZI|nr:uncharacterized protein BDY17DRAFT_325144 [Neohortaea acidophila]KAF2481621.1 hypothetical protein BDY17DRAFT_325144 [Neohortaea acidophila]
MSAPTPDHLHNHNTNEDSDIDPLATFLANHTPTTPKLSTTSTSKPQRKHQVRPKPTLYYQTNATHKLRALDKLSPDQKPAGLQSLIVDIRSLIAQSWKVLEVYYEPEYTHRAAHDANEVQLEKVMTGVSMLVRSKWEVVWHLTNMASQYADYCQEAKDDGVDIVTEKADEVLLGFTRDVLAAGGAAGVGIRGAKVAVVRDWEVEGVRFLLEAEDLGTEETVAKKPDGEEDSGDEVSESSSSEEEDEPDVQVVDPVFRL